jgi:hypothetical protein
MYLSWWRKTVSIIYYPRLLIIYRVGSSASLYLHNYFKSGHSGKSETYNNEILSKEKDFTCVLFEVWGFDFI